MTNIEHFLDYDAVLSTIWKHFSVPRRWSSQVAPKFYHSINQQGVLLQNAVAHVTDGFPFDVSFHRCGFDFEYSLMQRAKRIKTIHEGYRHQVEGHDRNIERLLFLSIVMAYNYVRILYTTESPM